MTISEHGLDFIKNEEGEVLHTYLDSAGIPTIGIGSTSYKDGSHPKHGDTITHDQAIDLLNWEVGNKTAALNGLLSGITLNQNQFDALCSLIYNIGIGAFSSSTLLKRIKAKGTEMSIREAFLMWDKITVDGKKKVSDGLHDRRKREADLYFKS